MSHDTPRSQEEQVNLQKRTYQRLSSEHRAKLDALRELLGDQVAEQALLVLQRENDIDRNIERFIAVLWPLVEQGKLEIPPEGYLVRRGSNRLVVESMKRALRLWIREPSEKFLADFETGLVPLPEFSEMEFKRRIINLPGSYSFKSDMSQVKSQGDGPMCTSFAVVACLEFLYKKISLSEGQLSHFSEKKYGDCRGGLALEHAMSIARDEGVVEDKYWQYDENEVCWSSPPDVYRTSRYDFRSYSRIFYRSINTVVQNMEEYIRMDTQDFSDLPVPKSRSDWIKYSLYNKKVPIAIIVPVWFASEHGVDAGWESVWGEIKMPERINMNNWLGSSRYMKDKGWHAVAICGYDDEKERFEFKNSWCYVWGTYGYGTLPYEYVDRFARTALYGEANP